MEVVYSVKDFDMHKHKRFRYGPPLFRPHRHFGGWFWLIGLAILFSSGHGVWPGILVLIGLSMVFGSLFREERRPEKQEPPFDPYSQPVTPPPAPKPVSSPDPIHSVDLLPATCPQCGGPVRSYEVKWTGAQRAACPYCGSNLPLKKAN
jgi:hypothetical protein